MTIEQRIKKLEKELAAMQAGIAKKVRTQHLEIADQLDHTRIVLTVSKTGPSVRLADDSGQARIAIKVGDRYAGKDAPVIIAADENGNSRINILVSKDGPRLFLCDEKGAVVWRGPSEAARPSGK